MRIARRLAVAALLSAGCLLGGCAEVRPHLSDDFGEAVKQDQVGQIADPDAHYTGDPAPGSHGSRVGLAQDHYKGNTVIQPAATSTSSATSGGGK